MDKNLQLYKNVLAISGVSGFEESISTFIQRQFQDMAYEVTSDTLYNVIGKKPAKHPKASLMIVAHMDTVGLQVTYITEKGFVYFQKVGAVDNAVLPGLRVTIQGRHGIVHGVIGVIPPHLQEEKAKPSKSDYSSLYIDIGVSNKDEALKLIQIGDSINFGTEYITMGASNEFICSPGLDDRLGICVLLRTAQLLQQEELEYDIYLVASTQEESGSEGARACSYRIDPDVMIAVDVDFAMDHPGVSPHQLGECELGKGPTINRGAGIHSKLAEKILTIAEKSSIPFQLRPIGTRTGTDADVVKSIKTGIAVALVSPPLRYMHSPSEVAALADIDYCANLLVKICQELQWSH